MNEAINVVNVTPVNPCPECDNLQQTLNNTVETMNETLNSFSNKAPQETEKEKKAKSFLSDFQNYIKSSQFKSDVNEASKKYNVPPKKLAQNFFEKALGTVGDILGVAISTICNAGHMIVNIAGTVCHGIINLIQNIVSGLASIVTFNKTCVTA